MRHSSCTCDAVAQCVLSQSHPSQTGRADAPSLATVGGSHASKGLSVTISSTTSVFQVGPYQRVGTQCSMAGRLSVTSLQCGWPRVSLSQLTEVADPLEARPTSVRRLSLHATLLNSSASRRSDDARFADGGWHALSGCLVPARTCLHACLRAPSRTVNHSAAKAQRGTALSRACGFHVCKS